MLKAIPGIVLISIVSLVVGVAQAGAPMEPVSVNADYDGDGKTDTATYDTVTGDWFLNRTTDGFLAVPGFGGSGFTRVRVGVGRPSEKKGAAAHVLGRIKDADRKRCFENTVGLAVDALDVILDEGVAEAMNRYNGASASGSEEEGER